MKISRDLKSYALAGFPGHAEDPPAARGDLELTPQLYRLVWNFRQDIECRAIHTAGQRYSLACVSWFADLAWLMASFAQHDIRDVQRVIAQHRRDKPPRSRQVVRRNRAEILTGVERLHPARNDAERTRIRTELIDQACEAYGAGACGNGKDRSAAKRDSGPRGVVELLTKAPVLPRAPFAALFADETHTFPRLLLLATAIRNGDWLVASG